MGSAVALGAFAGGGQLGGPRSRLVQFAGAVSSSRRHGLLLLGGELYIQQDLVAGTEVPLAARREDEGGLGGFALCHFAVLSMFFRHLQSKQP